MVFRDEDKQAIINNSARILSKIQIVDTDTVFTENNYIGEWDYEDYRYVPENGFIGQFVERLLDGQLKDLPTSVNIENKELNLKIGIVNGDTTTWYDYGNFIVTKPGEQDTTGITSFESSDYVKKFNVGYKNTNIYPCIALEQALEACNQADVELYTNGYVYAFVVPKDGLTSGSYSFNVDGTYYNFSTTKNLNFFDTLIYDLQTHKVIQKSYDNSFNVSRVEITPTSGTSSVGTLLSGKKLPFSDFINYDFVIENNQYEESSSCRDVIKGIATVAYSWARVGVDNKVHIDFKKKETSSVDTYNNITTDDYYEQDKQPIKFGVVNKVLLGMSQVEGENVYKTSSDYTEETECAIRLYDNPITYNEALRRMALNGCETLFGLEYTPMKLNTIGHPWLEGDDLVKVTNLSNQVLYTYPFNRKLSYKGYIKSELSSDAKTSIAQKYEFEGELLKAQKKTQLEVDKANGRITALVEDVDDLNDKYIDLTVDKTASGNPIEATDAGEYELESIGIDGKSYQNSTSAKNKFVLPESDAYNGITFTKNENGTFNLTGKATDNAVFSVSVPIDDEHPMPRGVYTLSSNISDRDRSKVSIQIHQYNSNNISSGSLAITANTGSSVASGNLGSTSGSIEYSIFVYSGANMNTRNIKVQLESGDEATTFEPYDGYFPSPSPIRPSEIKTVQGVTNLFDKENTIKGSFVNTTIVSNAKWCYNTITDFKIGENYCTSGGRAIISFFNGNTNISVHDITNATVIVPSNTTKMYVSTLIANDKFQLEKGSIAHEYVPYGRWLKQITHGKNFLKWEDNFSISVNNIFIKDINAFSTTILTKDLSNMVLSGDYSLLDTSLMRVVYSNKYPMVGEEYIRSGNLTTTSNAFGLNHNYKYVTIIAISISTSTFDMIKNSFQLEKGTVSTEYEEYKENTALIDMNKDNLFDKDKNIISPYYYNETNGNITQTGTLGNYLQESYIEVEPGTIYTMLGIGTYLRIIEYNQDKLFIKGYTSGLTSELSITTTANTKYIRVSFKDEPNNIKLYEGYEPYYEFAEADDTKDEFLDGKLSKNVEKYIINKDDITIRDNYTNVTYALVPKQKDSVSYNNYNSSKVLCTKALYYKKNPTESWDSVNMINHISDMAELIKYWIGFPKGTTLDEIKNQLDGAIIYYSLVESKTYKLSYEPLKLFKGYNYITLNDELYPNMKIKYLTDSSFNATYATRSELKIESDKITSEVSKKVSVEELDAVVEETNSKIEQTADSITQEVNGRFKDYSTTTEMNTAIQTTVDASSAGIISAVNVKFTNYSTTTEMNNAITQNITASENTLNAEISKKVDNSDYTSAQILLKINNDISSATIKASKINLNGVVTANSNFKILSDGSMQTIKAIIGGWDIDATGIRKNSNNYNIALQSQNSDGSIKDTDVIQYVFDNKNNQYNYYLLRNGYLYSRNGYFEGSVTAKSGNIGGFALTSNQFSTNISGIYNYDDVDVQLIQQLILHPGYGNGTKNILDADGNGTLNAADMLRIQRIINGTVTNDKSVSGTFVINTADPKHCIKLVSSGETMFDLGLGTMYAANADFSRATVGGMNVIVGDNEGDCVQQLWIEQGSSPRLVIETYNTSYAVGLSISDKRLKYDISDTQIEALPIINKIKLREFIYNNDENNEIVKIGYIADELQEIDEQFVFEVGDKKIKQINELYINSMQTKGIQELYQIIEKQQRQIDELKSQVDTLLSKFGDNS